MTTPARKTGGGKASKVTLVSPAGTRSRITASDTTAKKLSSIKWAARKKMGSTTQ